MFKKFRYGLMAVVALVMLFGVMGTAAAEEIRSLRGRRGVRGPITAIEENTLTIEGRRGDVLITTDDETRIHIIGQEEASLDDLNVGDVILARGQRQEDGDLLARLIVRQPDGDFVLGRVVDLGDESLVLRDRDEQEISISVGPDTIVALRTQEMLWDGDPAGRDALHEGMPLAAFGTAGEDGLSLEAHTLVSNRRRPRALAGHIASIEGDSFTLTTMRGQDVVVLTTAETRFHLPGVESPTLADFAVDDIVAVVGRPGGEGEVTARVVTAVPENRPQGRPVIGEITGIDGDEISLTTLNGNAVTIITDADTRYRIGRNTEAAPDDFAAGDRIAAFGTRDVENSTLLATHVMKRG